MVLMGFFCKILRFFMYKYITVKAQMKLRVRKEFVDRLWCVLGTVSVNFINKISLDVLDDACTCLYK